MASELQPNLQIGEFVLVQRLGRGGFGEVWMAMETSVNRPVALKFFDRQIRDDPDAFGRFRREAETLGKLAHDDIVTLYRVLDQDGYLALAMQFVDGTSLHAEIKKRGALPVDYVMSCVRRLLPALEEAHRLGIIHRDIKSENILLNRQGRPYLADFGIAVAEFAPRGTIAGNALGTPRYMSPEQIRDSRSLTTTTGGERSDIYSFGVLLFEMLTGRFPFDGDPLSIMQQHLSEPPPRLRDINPDVPVEVADVVRQCLEKNPDARPQSCTELLSLLESAVVSPVLGTGSKGPGRTTDMGRVPAPPPDPQ